MPTPNATSRSRLLAALVGSAISVASASAQSTPPTSSAPPAAPEPEYALRGNGLIPTSPHILELSTRGLKAGSSPTDARWLGWDHIASVIGPSAPGFEAFAPLANTAWRARVRLERGDLAAAEPLFEQLFNDLAADSPNQPGPTFSVIAGGLMRCRLDRGAQVNAIQPWLAFVQSLQFPSNDTAPFDATGPWIFDRATGRPALDELSSLAPGLPPIWLGTAAVQIAARTKSTSTFTGPAAILADLYTQSLRAEASLDVTLPAKYAPAITVSATGAPSSADEGVQLVADIVATRAADSEIRRLARQSLRARISRTPPSWVEAWCRVALGRSLVRESSRDDQLLGVVELMHLPARLEAENPYLAGIALAEGALAMLRLGDNDAAIRLRHDLFARFPGHPATEYEPLRGWVRETGDPDPAITPTNSTPPTQQPPTQQPSTRPVLPTPSSPPAPSQPQPSTGGPS